MLASIRITKGVVGALMLAAVLAAGGYALTNTYTFEETSSLSGTGAQTVQALVVNDIDYLLDLTDKSEVESITFTLNNPIELGNNADGVAYMKINTAYAWSACNAIADADTTVTCAITAPATNNITTIGSAGDQLRLVLAE